MDTPSQIPLLDRSGKVKARASVDSASFEFLSQWKWHFAHGYAVRTVYVGGGAEGAKYLTVHMHRLVMGLGAGGPDIDHINRDRLDNRRANLRMVTKGENNQNPSARIGGSSHHRGVSFNQRAGKWTAQTTHEGKRVYLGRFDSEDGAAAAMEAWRREHRPLSFD